MHIFKIDQQQRYSPAPPTPRHHSEPFQALNTTEPIEHSPDLRDYFSLSARSNTAVTRTTCRDESSQRQHEQTDIFTAPMVTQRLTRALTLCEVTVLADLEITGDQAGIFIFAGNLSTSVRRASETNRYTNSFTLHLNSSTCPFSSSRSKWAKIAIEQSRHGLPVIATTYANTSSLPDTAYTTIADSIPSTTNPLFPCPADLSDCIPPPVRLKLERVAHNLQMWYRILPSDSFYDDDARVPTPAEISREWRLCREIEGFFAEVSTADSHAHHDRSDSYRYCPTGLYDRTGKITTSISRSPLTSTWTSTAQNCWVGCYAARPSTSESQQYAHNYNSNHISSHDHLYNSHEYKFHDHRYNDECRHEVPFRGDTSGEDLFVEFEGLEVL